MNHLDVLNDQQKEAALHTTGPVVIIAGAGAGKTKTIVSRIHNLIHSGIEPRNILAITFTNKAASEMRERVNSLLGQNENELPFISTFHALCVYILRQNATLIGYSKYFSILDRGETLSLVKEATKASDLDPKQFEPKAILRQISNHKNNGYSFQTYAEAYGQGNNFFDQVVLRVWEKYDKLTKKQNAFDFDDLLLNTVLLLKKNRELLAKYKTVWTHIHIDEYQDTNAIQYELSKLLAGDEKNICVVGDIDQSIYSWRGADFENIMRFEKDFAGAKVVLLEENYRSTKTIIEAANQIIEKNKNRKDKTLFTKKEGGELVTLFAGIDEYEEARFVAENIKAKISEGQPSYEIAVLYRANFQSRVLEEILIQEDIPYHMLGVRFFERKEVKDTIAYLKASINRQDFESIKRSINTPKRGIGKSTVMKIAAGMENTLSPAILKKVNSYYSLLDEINSDSKNGKLSQTIAGIIKKSGLEQELKKGGPDSVERIENIKELVALAEKYNQYEPEEAVEKFLDAVALASDQDNLKDESGGVRLSTVHASKGLEFNTVFVTGLEQDLFPHAPHDPTEARDEEEERRLFYVAVTRARHKLFLTYAHHRTIFGSSRINMPSEFLSDIDSQLFDTAELPEKTFFYL